MKASILIPAFNASAYLAETLLSCVNQGLDSIEEIVIVDDHSEDETFQIANSFASQNPEIKFIIESNPKKGACAARNHAFHLSSAPAIQWLDADDLLGPGKLKRQLALLRTNPECLIASKWRRFRGNLHNMYPEEQGNWLHVPDESSPLKWLESERMMIPAGWLGTRILFQKSGPWDESLLINQDGEYFTRAVASSKAVIFEEKSRVFYRSGVTSSVSHFKPEKAESLYKSCQSFETVALSLSPRETIGTLISNKYQRFIYRVYPLVPELRMRAKHKIQSFGPPTCQNDLAESRLSRMICTLFGWRTLVHMRILKSKLFG